MPKPPDDEITNDSEPEAPAAGREASPAPARAHPRDPLHGITLQQMLEHLHALYGWAELGRRIPIRCFTHEPSMGSSLAFLRRQPWARKEVEGLFLFSKRGG